MVRVSFYLSSTRPVGVLSHIPRTTDRTETLHDDGSRVHYPRLLILQVYLGSTHNRDDGVLSKGKMSTFVIPNPSTEN